MAQPSFATVKIDTFEFQAFSTQFAVLTPHDGMGMPMMGATQFAIEVIADMHDQKNLSFDKIRTAFALSHNMTRDKIKEMKITYWSDDTQTNALSAFSFRGWISSFTILSGGGGNHALVLKLEPILERDQFSKITHVTKKK